MTRIASSQSESKSEHKTPSMNQRGNMVSRFHLKTFGTTHSTNETLKTRNGSALVKVHISLNDSFTGFLERS